MRKTMRVICVLSSFLMMGIAQGQSGGVVVVPLGGDTYQAGVAKTGQTLCYVTPDNVGPDPAKLIPCANSGQDGEFQRGVPWPVPRFTNNLNGTVRDNLTGLIWLKDANCYGTLYGGGQLTRPKALFFITDINRQNVDCGDTANSSDWRLANRAELTSLLDISQSPALPTGHPFSNVELNYYWTSSYHAFFKALGVGWGVHFSAGDVESLSWLLDSAYVWPVRGGN